MVQGDDLLAAVTAPPVVGSTAEGISPPNGLDISAQIVGALRRTRSDGLY
jgi:hypothetical protein